ncbi:hypothetical protein Tco_0606159 [Tanacetum coccineum]
MDYKQTKEYHPKVHRTRKMDDDLRESYRTLKKRLFHEGRIVTPYFIAENNMLPFFQAIDLKPFLTLNEPICPRFVVEFYHSLKVKRNEEDTPYIEFKLGQFTFKLTPSRLSQILQTPHPLETFYSSEWSINSLDDPSNSKFFGPKHDLVKKAIAVPRTTRAQLLRDPNTLYVDDIRPDLKGWELFFKENLFCSIDKRNKVKACTAYMLYYLTIRRKFNFTSMIIYRMEEVINKRKDISRNPSKEKGKNVISSPVISYSSSSSDDNEGPSFLEFYDELSDSEDLTKHNKRREECLNA